jgi:hypothetical protein
MNKSGKLMCLQKITKQNSGLGMEMHGCNLTIWEVETRGLWFEAILGKVSGRLTLSGKQTKRGVGVDSSVKSPHQ